MSLLLEIKGLAVAGRLHPSALQIKAGEFVGLIGPNGAGKTTLLRAALGLIKAQGFSSITAHPIPVRPRHAAYLAQDRELVWPIPVEELIAMGWRAHPDHRGNGKAEVQPLMDALGLAAFAARQVPQLSGGEKARVLLARALAQGAPLLVADEPCAALDPAQALRTAALLRAEADAGRAVLASLHDLPLAARYCTRLVVMQAGRICASDPPQVVIAGPILPQTFGISLRRFETATGPAWAVIQPDEAAVQALRGPT